MPSRADTLKIAEADVETARHCLAKARLGRRMFNDPEGEAEHAVRLLERTARNLRRAFNMNGQEAA